MPIRRPLHLVRSNQSLPNLRPPPSKSDSCPFEHSNGVIDCPHLRQTEAITSIQTKIQWLALRHPAMLSVFHNMIDRLQAQDAPAGAKVTNAVLSVLLLLAAA